MQLNIDHEVEKMRTLTVGQLLQKHREVCGQPSHSRHKQHLIRCIAWGMQARAEGGLSERALRRAAELVDSTDLNVSTATGSEKRQERRRVLHRRQPIPGTILSRLYKGRMIEVKVLEDGFQYEGEMFQTLSALAKRITGSHWNGYRFFGLAGRGRKNQ